MLRLAAVLALAASAAPACPEGTKCLTVTGVRSEAPYAPGDILPAGKYDVLLNSTYHGLPASDGSFWYFKVGRYVFKVDPPTMTVLEDVTSDARRLRR